MTRSKVAAKYINLVDRASQPMPTPLRQDPRPPYTAIERVDRPSISYSYGHGTEANSFFLEWSDLSLRDFVKSGLLGE